MTVKQWISLFVGVLLTRSAFGATPTLSLAFAGLPAWRQHQLAWTQQPWTGNDKPYVLFRRSIDQNLSKGSNPERLLQKFKALARKTPNSPQAQFKWGYSAWLVSRKLESSQARSQQLYPAKLAMQHAPFPGTYQYGRLLFLLEADATSASEVVAPVGVRLLQQNPKDQQVKYYLVGLLADSPSERQKQQATAYAQQLVKSDPRDPAYRAALGGIYFRWWLRERNQPTSNTGTYAQQALSSYNECLRLAPSNKEFRAGVTHIIAGLRNWQLLSQNGHVS